MNKLLFLNLVLGFLYFYHIDTTKVSKSDIVIAAIIILNVFLIIKLRRSFKKDKEGSS